MEEYIYWFLLAFGLLMLEMATGTYYMLMFSAACGIGGIAALLGLGLPLQMTLAAGIGVIGMYALRRMRLPANPAEQNLDIGQMVHVVSWQEDGTVRVRYRGAEWDAVPESADMPRDGTFFIKQINGSVLVLTHHQP